MKHTLKYLLLALLISVKAYAQEAVFTLGENNSVDDFISESFIGETNSEYLVLSRIPSISSISLLKGGSFSFKFMRVAYYNKETLNQTKLLAFPEFEGEGVTRSGNVYVEFSCLIGDTLQVFTTLHDKSTKNFFIHVWSLNANTLKPLTSKAKLLAQLDESQFDVGGVKVKYFDQLKQYGIVCFAHKSIPIKTSVNIRRIDTKNNILNDETIELKGGGLGAELKDFEIDESGNFYVLSAVSEALKPSWESKIWINVTRIPARGGEVSSNNIELSEGNPFTGLINVTPAGEVFVCGFYTLVVKPPGLSKVFSAGSYIAQIEPSSGTLLKVEALELTDNQKKALFVKDLTPTYGAMSYYSEIINISLKELHVNDVGDFTLVGIAKYSITSTTQSSYSGPTNITNYSNSIIVSKFNKSGIVEWNTVVPRFSMAPQITYTLNPIIFSKGGKSHILFNDNEDNIEPLNQLASGSKLKPKKNSKPIVYPATDSDEILLLDTWKGINSALRFTLIDQQGLWQVYWPTLTGAKGKQMLPLLDGTVYFKDKRGDLISIVYTEYSDLKLEKSALARIKFN
jgi:hypothetical protein